MRAASLSFRSRRGVRSQLAAIAAASVILWALTPLGRADAQKLEVFAPYEERVIDQTLAARRLIREHAPEGKRIEAVYVAAYDALLPSDLPLNAKIKWTVLNRAHSRTREHILRQELLFSPGDRYDRSLIAETERNLRSMAILTVARLIAVRGSAPDRVAILLVTKDRWTLRPTATLFIDNGRLDTMSMSIAEANLAGRAKRLALDFSVDPGRFAVGTSYDDPRLYGSHHVLHISSLIYLLRSSGQFDGGQMQLDIGRPLFRLSTRLSWQADFSYRDDIVRSFRGGDIALRPAGSDEVPDVYTRRNLSGNLQLTYSTGGAIKVNLMLALRAVHNRYDLPADFPAISSATRTAYLATLPRSESWAGPVLALELFTTAFIKLKNVDTLGLTEDFRLGPHFNLEARFASRYFGLPSDFVELFAAFNHQHYSRENLLDYGAAIGGRIQYAAARVAGYGSPLVNELASAYLREATPFFGPLRLVLCGVVQIRARDLDNVRLTLGADNGLRGYVARQFIGNSMYRVNVELRTRPLNLWSIHVGGVLFYDGGDAPLGWNQYDASGNFLAAGFHQDAGLGLRLLFPQIQRAALRLDLGFPFETTDQGYAPRFSAGFGQAF